VNCFRSHNKRTFVSRRETCSKISKTHRRAIRLVSTVRAECLLSFSLFRTLKSGCKSGESNLPQRITRLKKPEHHNQRTGLKARSLTVSNGSRVVVRSKVSMYVSYCSLISSLRATKAHEHRDVLAVSAQSTINMTLRFQLPVDNSIISSLIPLNKHSNVLSTFGVKTLVVPLSWSSKRCHRILE